MKQKGRPTGDGLEDMAVVEQKVSKLGAGLIACTACGSQGGMVCGVHKIMIRKERRLQLIFNVVFLNVLFSFNR